MDYLIDVAGIAHEGRAEVVKKRLSGETYADINVVLKRHGGNRHDRNAVGIYISKPGIWGFEESMIGFVERDTAKDISPMLKIGGSIISAKVVRVWLPGYSEKARPYVNIRIKTDWSNEDLSREQQRIKDVEKARWQARKAEKMHTINQPSEPPVTLFKKLFKLFFW